MGENAKGPEERQKVAETSGEPPSWEQWFAKRRDWLTRKIGSLEIMSRYEEAGLHPSWVLAIYKHDREILDNMDALRTKVNALQTVNQALERRLEILEGESSEEARKRKVREIEREKP
jgi:hypothetical protein